MSAIEVARHDADAITATDVKVLFNAPTSTACRKSSAPVNSLYAPGTNVEGTPTLKDLYLRKLKDLFSAKEQRLVKALPKMGEGRELKRLTVFLWNSQACTGLRMKLLFP